MLREESRPTPRVLPALAVTAALTTTLAGLTACDSSAPSAPSSGAVSTVSSTASSSEQTAQVIAMTVTGGKVSGATGRVPVQLGSTVRLQVTADVTEEVHVHGYDLMKDTVPGQPVTIEFAADVPGVFEVELEQSKLPLTRLQVQ